MGRQQQRALTSWSSAAVAVVGVVGAGSTRGAIALVVVGGGVWGLATGQFEELVGELLDIAEPRRRPLGPCIFAVALDVARRAVALTESELDVHVVFEALVCDRRLGSV